MTQSWSPWHRHRFVAAALALALAGCGGGDRDEPRADEQEVPLESGVRIDGSSTVFPIVFEARRQFRQSQRYPISIRFSGTGAGFRRFCAGETTINAASRPITQAEKDNCEGHDIEFVELPIAYDGIAVVVHQSNRSIRRATVEELRRVWQPSAEGEVMTWRAVFDSYPEQRAEDPLHLYGPGQDSGTRAYFAEAVVGGDDLRTDYTASEDDEDLVRRLLRDPYGMAFFGYSYYARNRGRLRALAINDGNELNGEGAVTPNPETIAEGEYQPLSRPLFLYIRRDALDRDEVAAFARTFVDERQARTVVPRAGYVTLRRAAYQLALQRLNERETGSSFMGAHLGEGLTVEMLLQH